jgi:hypothetical protein
MAIVIDDTTIKGILGVAGSVSAGITLVIGYLFKKGYIDIWLTKLFTSTEVIHAVKKQNGNALAKLNTKDDLFCVLESFDVGKNGNIVLKGEGRVNKLLNESRPLTTYEKDEIIRAVKNVLCVEKEGE